MLPSLQDLFIADAYFGVLHTSNQPISAGLQPIYDGFGNQSCLKLSDDDFQVGSLNIPLSAGSNGQVLGVVDQNLKFFDVFPVGSVYFTAINTTPNSFLGGNWIRIGQGRFVVGVGTGTDSNGISKTMAVGNNHGEYVHALKESELASHTHSGYGSGIGSGGAVVGKVTNPLILSKSSLIHENDGHTSRRATTDTNLQLDGELFINSSGSGEPFTNSPPSIGLYIWQRIA